MVRANLLDALRDEAQARGLALRGAFHPEPADRIPDLAQAVPTATLVLFGNVGPSHWNAFRASPESCDGQADPLDRWSRRNLDAMAAPFGARVLLPFGGPPWHPFQSWAMRAEPVHKSPLGILIHPKWGLWHAYRGALAFRERFDLPERESSTSPCDACIAKPCLATCPVDAVSPARFDAEACHGFVSAPAGSDCLHHGCAARRSCPVGVPYRYNDDQAAFHARAFLASR
jgi:hypothetical protein